MGLHCLPRPELLKVHSFRLFSCFKLTAWQNLIINSFVVNMQDFKKDMKQIYFLEFQIVQGATSETFSLPPANSTCDMLISNTLYVCCNSDHVFSCNKQHEP